MEAISQELRFTRPNRFHKDIREKTMDYQIPRSSRRCSVTERELLAGETYYSVLLEEGPGEVRRLDYSRQAWQGAPENALGWWQARMPLPEENKTKLAPNDALMQVFDQLAHQPRQQEMRYVLSLLLLRRRVFQFEDEATDQEGHVYMTLYCPRRDTTYEVLVVEPEDAQAEQIQQKIADLLFADAT